MTGRIRNPVQYVQGEITAQVRLDDNELKARRVNARDINRTGKIYPGGTEDENHVAMPGELIIGRRGAKNFQSKKHEMGVVSMNGARIEGCYEGMHREYYFIGVTKTPSGNETNGQNPHAAGFSAYRAGKVSIINNNSQRADISAGDFLVWQMQPWDDLRQANPMARYSLNGNGTPIGKSPIEVAPLKPTEFGPYLVMIKKQLKAFQQNAFSMDLFLVDQAARTQKYTDLEEETARWVLGIVGLADNPDFYAEDGKNLNWNTVVPLLEGLLDAKPVKYNRSNLREHARSKSLSYLCEAATQAMLAKLSRVIGVAMAGARAGETFPASIGQANFGL
jgi:hypothetical protein